MPISVIVNTINEEKNIERAILSVKSFADEVIVVDMESTDKTVSIAKKLGAKVYSHERTNYVEPARNFAIQKATNEWILILDADEEIKAALIKRLKEIESEGRYSFVRIPRKNIIFGKWMKHARWWPDYNVRFFKKGSVVWDDAIHSVPVTTGDGLNMEEREDLSIVHHNYQTVEQFVDRLNRYTTIQSKELFKKGIKVSFVDFIKRPTGEFLSRFFAGEGYKDGLHGLAVSLLQAFSELVLYAKVWQLQGFPENEMHLQSVVREIRESQREVNYWKAHALVQKNGGISAKLKRKLRLT